MLNRSKGPAVWSPRAQCDRGAVPAGGAFRIGTHASAWNLPRGRRRSFSSDGSRVQGVVTHRRPAVRGPGRGPDGRDLPARPDPPGPEDARCRPAGRARARSWKLRKHLLNIGLTSERFKTGTPPRIDGRSVDLSRLDRQDGDPDPYWFSFHERAAHPAQLPCYLTRSGEALREIILRHLQESALYGGAISGRGPRYCPSIEDKIVKFPEAVGHQVFLEPEGLDTSEMYVNGLSTSLPPAVQLEFLRTVPGLEAVRMTRPGYAIEYDYFPPTQLRPTLEVAGGARPVPRRPGQRDDRIRGGGRPGCVGGTQRCGLRAGT